MLVVNASFAPGEFFRIPITGLCENTTYEFSSWMVNLTPSDSPLIATRGNPQPNRVRFEILDASGAPLPTPVSGSTGNISPSLTPIWTQYGLVFQTPPGQTSVILRMINEGAGGYGNDLAIDDIVFKSCGDNIDVEDSANNNTINLCSGQTPYATTLSAIPDNSVFSSHFYQWQESSDGTTWNDIPGETNANISISGITTTTYYRAKVAESAGNLNNALCNTLSDVFQIDITQAPAQPAIDCWETATLNNTTCTWDVTGTQPTQPTLECWETAAFNTTTCTWDVSGTQPAQPAIDCWETATFNNTTCMWDVTGTQPIQPTLDCWETANFNTTTCMWDVTGTQPGQPTIDCWETTIFNNTTCTWDTTGTQPTQPTVDCWETATFNNITCTWDITGTQPTQPALDCWETANFNTTTCMWDVTGTQPGMEFNEDVVICSGDTPTLQANTSIINPVFEWNSGETTSILTINSSGIYSVEISSATTCDFETRNFNVTQAETPIIDNVKSDGNNIIVFTSNTGDFEYSLNGINFQSSNTFTNVQGGAYTILVKHKDCPDTVAIQHTHFFIPKFFTPNGDTVNDTFDLKGIESYSYSQVSIFDRYGKLLKNSVNAAFSWDGTFNNQLLPTGDYWYVIIIDNQKYTGHFTLKR